MTFILLAVILIAADQITKYFTLTALKPLGSIEILKGILNFTYVENRGAAFGIFQNARWMFITVTLITIIAIIGYIIKSGTKDKTLLLSLSLILSGGIGNMIDRIFRGFVVDMIEVTFIDYPVFNLADCCVVIGAIILAIYILFIYKEPKKDDIDG